MHIFIVEDDSDMREALTIALSSRHQVVAFADSESALAAFDFNQPDVILLDLFTKSIHGVHFLQRMRQKPNGAHTKVIVLTNIDKVEFQSQVAEFDVHHYLLKANTSISDIQTLIESI